MSSSSSNEVGVFFDKVIQPKIRHWKPIHVDELITRMTRFRTSLATQPPREQIGAGLVTGILRQNQLVIKPKISSPLAISFVTVADPIATFDEQDTMRSRLERIEQMLDLPLDHPSAAAAIGTELATTATRVVSPIAGACEVKFY